jgi:hypothetical protein
VQIGINYSGSAVPLAGCVNDIRGWDDLLRSFGCSFNTHIICRQVIPQHSGCCLVNSSHGCFGCSDEDAHIAGTEKQRGAKKSDILSAMQDIRGAMISCGSASNKYARYGPRCTSFLYLFQLQILIFEFLWARCSRI